MKLGSTVELRTPPEGQSKEQSDILLPLSNSHLLPTVVVGEGWSEAWADPVKDIIGSPRYNGKSRIYQCHEALA